MARVRELAVWLHGQHVAWLRSPRIGTITCTYLREVLASHDIGTPLLSCSVPVRPGTVPATAFVVGLLPEGQHRAAMAALAGLPTTDVLGLLARFGRDVAGAVTLAPLAHPGPGPAAPPPDPARVRSARAVVLGPGDLEHEVTRLPENPLGLHPDSELSLAGLQDKLLLVATDDGWARPVNGYPSSHILKLDNAVHHGLVRAEHACLRLAAAAGLAAARSELTTVAGIECLVVERFDRRRTEGQVTRLHQEDACQALGVNPEGHQGRAKYQRDGGPSLRDVADVLTAWGSASEESLLDLLDRVLFTLVIGDANAHGKNLALLHVAPGQVHLAPLYDTVPTALWPSLRTEAAMSVDGRYDLRTITIEDVVREARSWGLGAETTRRHLDDVLARLTAALADGASRDDPRVTDLVATRLARLTQP